MRVTDIIVNIYNGNIFPSLNPAKIFQFISQWIESTKSSAIRPNHRAVINTSNEVKSPLLWELWIYYFSLRILERVLGWKHCKYKEWVSFFLGSWGMNRSAEQTNRPRTASRLTRFVCPVLRFIPHEPRKKDTHSLNIKNPEYLIFRYYRLIRDYKCIYSNSSAQRLYDFRNNHDHILNLKDIFTLAYIGV